MFTFVSRLTEVPDTGAVEITKPFGISELNTSVIVISMAVGMACFFLIALFIQREFSSDDFNAGQYRRLYRAWTGAGCDGDVWRGNYRLFTTPVGIFYSGHRAGPDPR